jgi:hypothetical protein
LSVGPWSASNKWAFSSIIDSYDEIMDFIFPPSLYFYDEFRVGAWDMFFSQSVKVLHWKKWLERMEKLVEIQDLYP